MAYEPHHDAELGARAVVVFALGCLKRGLEPDFGDCHRDEITLEIMPQISVFSQTITDLGLCPGN